MSLRLEKQFLRVDTVIGENTAQSVVEGSLSVPGNKPEIGRALRVKAQPNMTGYNVVEGRVAIEGTLDLDLLYASFTEVESAAEEGDEEPELILEERLEKASFAGAVPFAFVLDVAGAEPDMQAQVGISVESVNYEVQGDQRTVDVDVVLEFTGLVKKASDYVFTTRALAAGDVSVEQKDVRVTPAAVAGRGQTHIEGLLPFGGRVLPDQVLELALQPAGAPIVKVTDGAAEISGQINCTALYTAQEIGAARIDWTEVIPYSVSVQLPGVAAQSKADASVKVTDIHWSVVDSDNARGLEVNAALLATAQANTAKVVSVVTGLTSQGPMTIATRTEPILLQEAIGEGSTSFSADASLELPAGAAPVERVLAADARARVEDVHVLGDKVAIEGAASLSLVYVGRSGDTTSLAATAWPAGVPFDFEVAVPGAEPGLDRRVEISVDKVEVDLINRENVEATLHLTAKVYLARNVEVDCVVEAVEVAAVEPNPPTYTFVVLQEDDTLWQLAQKYHTDVVAILQANKWLESESAQLTVGTKICIPRFKGAA